MAKHANQSNDVIASSSGSAPRLGFVEERRGPAIAVLAPSPLVTVTIEKGPKGTDEIYFHAGGQGFWVARMLYCLGASPVLCGPFGGESGMVIHALMAAEGISVEAVKVRGWNGSYVHDRRAGTRKTVAEAPIPHLDRHETDDLYDAALVAGLRAGTMILTGTVEHSLVRAEFFRRIAIDLSSNGITVLADLSGAELKALSGGVDFLKVSHTELIESGYCDNDDRSSLLRGLEALKGTGARNIIVSCAEAPALVWADGQLLEVVPPAFEPLDFRGAGDSMTAALAFARASHLDTEATLRLAVAAGAVNVTRHGLGTGHIEHIREISRHVRLRNID
jgi:1-phosphofructokinase